MQDSIRSSWPRDGELTEAHHQKPRQPSYSDWLCRRADQLGAAKKGVLSVTEFESYLLLIAEHLADDSASKRHSQGMCIVWGCSRFAAGPLALRCAEHQASELLGPDQASETDALGPYGLDDASSQDPYRDWLDFGDDPIIEHEKVLWKQTRKSRIVRSHTVEHVTEGTVTESWESDSHTFSR